MRNRTKEIYNLLVKQGEATVSELAKVFNVTEKTIRIDLQKLEDSQLVVRTYGGASLSKRDSSIYPSYHYDKNFHVAKIEIGIKAQDFIKPYSTIALDDGTTNLEIVKHIKCAPVNIITNDFAIAQEASKNQNIHIFFIGGNVRSNSDRLHTFLSSAEDVKQIKKMQADICFLGTNSISPKDGFMIFNDHVKSLKEVFMKIGKKTIVVANAVKFDKSSFITFANFKKIDTVITDSSFNKYNAIQYNKKGLNIIIADKYKGE